MSLTSSGAKKSPKAFWVGTARLRRPRRVQRRNVGRDLVEGVIYSARYYAGGDGASAPSLPLFVKAVFSERAKFFIQFKP